MMKWVVAFFIPVCLLIFSCDWGSYGDFLIVLNEYEDGVVFCGANKDIKTEVLYIPETMYGLPVVEIAKSTESEEIYSKEIVVPKSVEKIGKESFDESYYPSLETIIITGDIENLDGYAFVRHEECSTTIVFLTAETPPEVESIYHYYVNYFAQFYHEQILKFYVPDSSLDVWKNARGWSNYEDSIYPLSQYSGKLP